MKPYDQLRAFSTDIDDITDRFKVIDFLGEGSFGKVIKALDTNNNEIVALKQLKPNLVRADVVVREISILKTLNHKNIYKLYDILFCTKDHLFYLTFEYCQHDLQGLIDTNSLGHKQIKEFMGQILSALDYLDQKQILHMDIKPENILVKNGDTIKLADFGLARKIDPGKLLPNEAVTCAYRPFELFLGKTSYGTEIDIWSAGVTFYQMMTREQLFSKTNKPYLTLISILEICGTPKGEDKEELESLPKYSIVESKQKYPGKIQQIFANRIDKDFQDIAKYLTKMLSLNPKHRPTAKDLLSTQLFSKDDVSDNSIYKLQELHQRYYSNYHRNYILLNDLVRPPLPTPFVSCY